MENVFERVTEEVDFGGPEFCLPYKAVFRENDASATLKIVYDT